MLAAMQDVASIPLDGFDALGPAPCAADGHPHAGWARLRPEDPVHRVSRGIDRPFWAIPRHVDLVPIRYRLRAA